MSKTFIQKQREKILSAKKQDSQQNLSEYQNMQLKLRADLARVKGIANVLERKPLKRELLADYKSWVDGVLEAKNPTAQDDVFVQCFIWSVDVCDYQRAFEMLAVINQAEMQLPDRFSRDANNFYFEQVAEAVHQSYKDENKNAEDYPSIATMTAIYKNLMANIAAVVKEVVAKFERAIGHVYEISAEIVFAIDHYEKALVIDHKIGLKKIVSGLKKDLEQSSKK